MSCARRLVAAGEAIATAAHLFDFTRSNKPFDHAWQMSAAPMAQAHAVGDLANPGGLRELGKVRDHFVARDFFFALRLPA